MHIILKSMRKRAEQIRAEEYSRDQGGAYSHRADGAVSFDD